MRATWITRRCAISATSVIAVSLVASLATLWYASRAALRAEAAYNAEMLELHRDYERRMRIAIDCILPSQLGTATEKAATDQVYDLLSQSRVANNSREVAMWNHASHSPARTSIALKWTRVAVAEAG